MEAFHSSANGPVIESTAPKDHRAGYSFRSWRYARIQASIVKDKPTDEYCLDSGTTMSIADRSYVLSQLPEVTIHRTSESVRVRGIGTKWHDTSEYVLLDFYIPGQVEAGAAVAHFTHEVHLVDDLTAKILIGIDVIVPEAIVIDGGKQIATIGSCGLTTKLHVTSRGNRIDKVVRALQQVIIPPHTHMAVPVKIRGHAIPNDRDYSFHPQEDSRLGAEGGFFAHITDAQLAAVQVRNATNQPVVISRNAKIGKLLDYDEEGCFLATPDDRHLAVKSSGWLQKASKWATAGIAGLAALEGAFHGSTLPATHVPTTTPSIPVATSLAPDSMENGLPNGITIYGDASAYTRLATVAEAYPSIWQEKATGTVKVPEADWMSVDTIPGAKIEPARVFKLGKQDRDVIDKEFDELHRLGKLSWTTEPTPYAYPCFVVWRTVHLPGKPPERKGRVVVDIRGLNKITQFDAYPMQLQSDLIAAVAGCTYISIFDCTSFFHQWLVKLAHRHKLTVVTHRGSEQWNVAPMGFRNSPAYVQRQIDHILRDFRAFARAYVDDIVVFSKSLEEHLRHLNQVFALFTKLNIALKPSKTYLGYPTISLLGQRVDRFGLSTAQEKLAAILRLRFPKTLKDLETYLGMTGWLRDYVPFYAQKADALRKCKTMLLKASPSNQGRTRKDFSRRTPIHDATDAEWDSYNQLQGSFSRLSWLIHQDPNRVLYADVDGSRKGFGVIVYHLKSDKGNKPIDVAADAMPSDLQKASADKPTPTPPKRKDVEPIMFLSRMLTPAEEKYWPTELEMAGLVWLVKRIRHLIEAAKHVTIIYTDHAANPSIARQTKLTSSSVDKLNMKLVRASAYLSQFRLDIRYKPGKSHIIPDALSRLPTTNRMPTDKDDVLDIENFHNGMIDPEDDVTYAYNHGLIAISPAFKQKLQEGYKADKAWVKILAMLEALNSRVAKEKDDSPDEVSKLASLQETSESNTITNQASGKSLPQTPPDGVSMPSAAPPPSATPNDDMEAGRQLQAREASNRRTGVDFQLIDGLIYHVHEANGHGSGEPRLCISENCQKDVFKVAHDDNFHAGQHRAYRRLVETVYMPSMSRKLRLYLRHCPACQLNQTKRHSPYGELAPISTSPLPFHTIAMDFILALPDIADRDVMLTLTDKATRQLQLIPGRSTWSATQWAHAVVDRLQIANWGIPEAIISDRDRKFTSEFWTAFFGRLGTTLLMSSAYHPQTDGLSERSNQTVEIALRYIITEDPDVNWVQALPALQAQLNNAPNATTGRSPNEVVYGFKVRDVLTALTRKAAPIDVEFERYRHQQEAADATSYAMAKAKIIYDSRHTPLLLKPGDHAFLRLHKGYTLPSDPNAKLSNQRTGPFLVKRRIGRLAYELDLPPQWRVHPVISVTQLEPAPSDEDPYHRPRPDHPGEVEVEGLPNTKYLKNYEVEKIVDKRLRKYNRTVVTQYLIRWKGYGPEYDEWKSIAAMAGSPELVEEYERLHPTNLDLQKPTGKRQRASKLSKPSTDVVTKPRRG